MRLPEQSSERQSRESEGFGSLASHPSFSVHKKDPEGSFFSRRNKPQIRAPFRQEASLSICFLFDLEIFNDLHIDLVREVTAHSEEELAFCVMPDIITDVVCRDIAIYFIVSNDSGEVLTIIIGIPDIY